MSSSKRWLQCAALCLAVASFNACSSGSGGAGGGSGGGSGGGAAGGSGGGTAGGSGGGSAGGSGGGTAGGDGGFLLTDGGVNCQLVPLDSKLGTLVLGTGFTVQEAPALPASVMLIERNGTTSTSPLFALGTTDAGVGVFNLGTWPTLSAGSSVQKLTAPADAAATTFASLFLVSDGTSLIAGYTKSGTPAPGSLLLLSQGTTASWINAPGNYSATSVNSRFVVNGEGLGTSTGVAVYGLNAAAAPPTSATLGNFSSSWMASSGVSAAANNGVLVLGYYGGADFKNHLLVVPPSTYLGPLTGGTSFSLSTALEIYADLDVLNAVGFKDGLAIQHGGFPPPTYDPVTTSITRIPLTLTGSGTQTVTAGAAQTVLTAPNQCTSVDFVSHLGDDLLIAVKDRNGRRLVRLVKP